MRKFKIYAVSQDLSGYGKDFFEVFIHATQKDMAKATKEGKAGAFTQGIKFRGMFDIFGNVVQRTAPGRKSGNPLWIKPGKIGEIHFYEGNLLQQVIVHECVHAFFRTVFMQTSVINIWLHEQDENYAEEYMAHLVDGYVGQITDYAKKHGLIRKNFDKYVPVSEFNYEIQPS